MAIAIPTYNHHKHPVGLWFLAWLAILVNFSFGTINSLLVLYLTHPLHFSQKEAYPLVAAFNSLIFATPIVGGYLAGKFGYKQACLIGLIMCLIGAASVTIVTKVNMYFGLAAFVIGIGLAVTAFYCLVDLLYAKQDVRRESGFTLYYLLFNIGFLAAGIVGGYVSQDFGYHYAFVAAAAALIVAIISLLLSWKMIQPHPTRSMAPQIKWPGGLNYLALIVFGGVFIPLALLMLKEVHLNNMLLWLLVIGASIGLIVLAWKQRDKIARYKLYAFLALCIISIVFWSLYMLESSLLTIFIEKNVNRVFFGSTIPPSAFYGLDPFFIISLGFFFSWAWRHLAERNKNPTLPTKFSASLIVMGCGYLLFVVGIYFCNQLHQTSMFWVVAGYLFLTTAELLLSPVGLAMVGRLSPVGKEGILMGVWQLFTGFSAVVSGYLASMTVVPKARTPAVNNPIYSSSFTRIGLAAVIIGVITIFFIPAIKRLIYAKGGEPTFMAKHSTQ